MLASGEYQGLRQRERLRKPPCDMYLARLPPGEFQAGFQEVEGISLGYLQVDGRRMFSLAQVLSDLFKDIPRTTISKRMESLRIKSRRCDLRELRTLKAMQSLPSRAVQGSLISREDLAVLCQEARRRRRAEPTPQLPLPLPGSKQGTSAGYSSDSDSSLEVSSSGSDSSGDSSSAEEEEGAGSSDSDSGDSVQSTRYRQAALPEPDPSLLRLSQHLWARSLHGQSWGVSGRSRGQAEGEQGPSGVDRRQGKPRSRHQRSVQANPRTASEHSRSAPADPRITTGHSRTAPMDLTAGTGLSRPADVDSKASTGHSRAVPVDSKASTGHSRPTPVDPRAATGQFRPDTVDHKSAVGHSRSVVADPRAGNGHSRPLPVDPRAAAGHYWPVPLDPRAATVQSRSDQLDPRAAPAKERSAVGHARSSHGDLGYATGELGSAHAQERPAAAALEEVTASSRATSRTVELSTGCQRPAPGDLETTFGCQGDKGTEVAYQEDPRSSAGHRGDMGVAAGYPGSGQTDMKPTAGFQGDLSSEVGYHGELKPTAGYRGDLGLDAGYHRAPVSTARNRGLVHSDLGPAVGYQGSVHSDLLLESGYNFDQESVQSDLGLATEYRGDLESSAGYQGPLQSFVGSVVVDLGFSSGNFVGDENHSGAELDTAFSEGDFGLTELDLRIGKRARVYPGREQDSSKRDQGLTEVGQAKPLTSSRCAGGQLGSVALRLAGGDIGAAERPYGPADLRSRALGFERPTDRDPGAADGCLGLADIDLGAADRCLGPADIDLGPAGGNQGIAEAMLESSLGGPRLVNGLEAVRCISPLLAGHDLVGYEDQQTHPPSPVEDWGATPSIDNKETTDDVPACEGDLQPLPRSPSRDSPEPRREHFDRLIRQSKLWCYAKGFSADGKDFRLSFGRAPASKRARSGSTPSKKAFKGSGSERNAKRRRLPKGTEPARQQSRRRRQARPGRKRKSSSAAPTPARRPFTLLEHFPCTPSLVLGADGDLNPAYSLGAGRSRSVPKPHPFWRWQLGGSAIPLPPSLKFRSFPPMGYW